MPCKLTTIATTISCDLEGEICQTFHIVPNERVEFAREGGWLIRPFSASQGETREPARAARLNVYLTRSNLIKNLIKSDF